MRDILTRKSVIAFVIISLAGLFAPLMTAQSPYAISGAPFARPVWWRSATLPATRDFEIKDNRLEIEWNKRPPAIFSLTGQIAAEPGANVRVIWHTPERDYLLDDLSGSSLYWINQDGRDMIFKQALGLPLISRSVDYLFPLHGRYALTVEGAKSAELKLSLPGERQGLMGTDQRGRDVFTRLIYGIRTSLIIGISATIIASLLGMAFGLTAGYIGGWCDTLIMRLVDILLSIPTLPILMVLAGIWGKGLWQLVLILSIFSWMGTARSIRALVLTVRESPGSSRCARSARSADIYSGGISCRRPRRYCSRTSRSACPERYSRRRGSPSSVSPTRGSSPGGACSTRPIPSEPSPKGPGGCCCRQA